MYDNMPTMRKGLTHKVYFLFISAISLSVIFLVYCGFSLNGMAQDLSYACGKVEHTHTDACYENVLACGYSEDVDPQFHQHTSACYKKKLVCGLEEHKHTDACKNAPAEDSTTGSAENNVSTSANTNSQILLNTTSETNATSISGDVSSSITSGGDYILSGNAWNDSTPQFTITSDTTLDLNGHVFYHKGSGALFNVTGGTLTIKDSRNSATTDIETVTADTTSDKYGNTATLTYGTDGTTPNILTYYVTETVASGQATTETLKKHVVDFASNNNGSISGQNKGSSIIAVGSGATFNMEGGLLCIGSSEVSRNVIYNNSGTVNLTGGYVAGTHSTGNGAGIYSNGGTLNLSGGVVAGNSAARGGGIAVENNNKTYISGSSVISGNYTNGASYGGGIFADTSYVEISGGYITNNKMVAICDQCKNNGCHGGGGIAMWGGSMTNCNMYDGAKVTGNYSESAGGGIYIGCWSTINQSGNMYIYGGIVAANACKYSEGAGIRVAGKNAGGSVLNVIQQDSTTNLTYITNNSNIETYSWGGGGVFVQENGTLNIQNSLITNNTSDGYGGGIANCPSGVNALVANKGAAIFGNTANGKNFSQTTYESKKHDSEVTTYDSQFATSSYNARDYFSVKLGSTSAISLISGIMLGGGDANWLGRIDNGDASITGINYGTAKVAAGLYSNPSDDTKTAAISAARVIITGNYSYTHGAGIMSNGKTVIGQDSKISVGFKFNAYKTAKNINDDSSVTTGLDDYKFQLTSDEAGSNVVLDDIASDSSGKVSFSFAGFDTTFSDTYKDFTYYLKEKPDTTNPDVVWDSGGYKITFRVYKTTTSLGDITVTSYFCVFKDASGYTAPADVLQKMTKNSDGSYSYTTLTLDTDYTAVEDTSDGTITVSLVKDKTSFVNNIKADISFIVLKVKKDTTEALSGAVFTLMSQDGKTTIGTYTTGTDGKITIPATAIEREYNATVDYALVETTVPTGYDQSKVAGPWLIEVGNTPTADTTVNLYDAVKNTDGSFSKKSTTAKTITKDASAATLTTYTTTVENTPTAKYILPTTGGPGFLASVLGGLCFCAASGVLILTVKSVNRKRRLRRLQNMEKSTNWNEW